MQEVSGRAAGFLVCKWLDTMPKWAMQAYFDDPLVHKIVMDCGFKAMTYDEMQWAVCEGLYKQGNDYREELLRNAGRNPINL